MTKHDQELVDDIIKLVIKHGLKSGKVLRKCEIMWGKQKNTADFKSCTVTWKHFIDQNNYTVKA